MKFVWIILFLFSFVTVYSQRCLTDAYPSQSHVIDNSLGKKKGTLSTGRDTLPGEVIVVPVVVHLLYNSTVQNISDEQIIAQIDALNRDFRRKNADTVNTPLPFKQFAADTRITFCLAKVDPKGYKTTGIVRKYTKETSFMADDKMKFSSKGGDDAWDPSKYLNIWVCDLFGRVLGYATLPGSNPEVDGIVIKYSVFGFEKGVTAPYNKGRTLTHEMGHWLGLKHIWGDMVDSGCGSDGIDDTPPQTGSNTGCNTFPKLSSCSVDSNGDMFMNFMDLSDDACMNLFTAGQKIKMRSQFSSGGARNTFLDSDLCDGSGAQEAPQVNEDDEESVIVYPNPIVNRLIIKRRLVTNSSDRLLEVYNIQGKLLIRRWINSESETIGFSRFADGLYLVSIGEGSGRKTYKILKQSGGNKN